MPLVLEFMAADPAVAAAELHTAALHLWRIPYARPLGRAPLVALLAAYLGVPEAAIELVPDARGKPRLAGAHRQGQRPLHFNWSHSGDHALIALALDVVPGVDIERLRPNPRALDIARRYFDPREADALAALPASAREGAFIGLWCAKEAVLKAAGTGLAFGLGRLAFRRLDDGDWALQGIDPALGPADEWQLSGFAPVRDYRGALAWRGETREIVGLQPIAV